MEECHVQPLLEMSQDCIVEWNESQHVSDFATTPQAESPRTSSGVIALDEVRRKLDEETTDRGDEEINAIFHLLQQEDEGLLGTSPSRVATQRTKNSRKESMYINRPVKNSLASRRRRRQRERDSVSNKRPHRTEPTGTPVCNTPPHKITEGAFDSLLKQLKQSSERTTPQPIGDKENSNIVHSSSHFSKSPLQRPGTPLSPPPLRAQNAHTKEPPPQDLQTLTEGPTFSDTCEAMLR